MIIREGEREKGRKKEEKKKEKKKEGVKEIREAELAVPEPLEFVLTFVATLLFGVFSREVN